MALSALEMAALKSRLQILLETLTLMSNKSESEIRGMIDAGLRKLGRDDLADIRWPYLD